MSYSRAGDAFVLVSFKFNIYIRDRGPFLSQTPPVGILDVFFLAIPSLTHDVYTRSYLSFVRSLRMNATSATR